MSTYEERARDYIRSGAKVNGDDGPQIEIIRASTIKPRPIAWLWPGWLAGGKLHVAAGAPGTGKSSVAFALAATVTCGGRFPDGTVATPGNVVIWSGEDDPDDTIVPRLIACGADLSRVFIVGSVRDDGGRRPFDPAIDIPKLRDAVRRIDGGVSLLIVDPIVSAVLGDSHKNAEVRRGLQPLVDLASDTGAAVLGISHFTKGTAGRDPVERIIGSIAFGALSRVTFAVAKMPEDEGGGRVFCRGKSNIGADSGGFGYDLDLVEIDGGITVAAVRWSGAIDGTAREILAKAETPPPDDEKKSALQEAEEFLSGILENGPVPKREIVKEAKAEGISYETLKRAKKSLGVVSEKRGFGKDAVTYWSFPEGHFQHTGSKNDIQVHTYACASMGKIEPVCADTTFTDRVINYTLTDREGIGIVLPEQGETIEEAAAKLREQFGDRITFVRPGDTAEGSL